MSVSAVGPSLSSGSKAFDLLRDHLNSSPTVLAEVEAGLAEILNRIDPAERENRFAVGDAAELIVCAASLSAGLVAPSSKPTPLERAVEVRDGVRKHWIVKSQSSSERRRFRITNGLGGAGKGFTFPIVFLAPGLGGLVYASPTLHPHLVSLVNNQMDSQALAFGHVVKHKADYPGCFAPLTVALNPNLGSENVSLNFAESLLVSPSYPALSKLF